MTPPKSAAAHLREMADWARSLDAAHGSFCDDPLWSDDSEHTRGARYAFNYVAAECDRRAAALEAEEGRRG